MGGSSSQNQSPPAWYTTYQGADQQAIQQFLATDAGKVYQSDYATLQQNIQNPNVPQSVTATEIGTSGEGMNISDMMSAFSAWQNNTDTANTGWSAYAKLAAQEAGGQGTQTILSGSSGASATPYQTILAAQQAQANGSLGDPTQQYTTAPMGTIGPKAPAPKVGLP